MLSISGLQVGYGAFTAVHGLDLEVGRSGQIVFDGRDITGLPAARRAAAGLAIAPEGRRLFADLSVAENLVIGGYAQPRQAADRNRARVIELFPRLGQRLAQTAGTLSGGEQQMLAIGRALMAEPKLLMIDELSLGLMPKAIDVCYRALERLRASGLTILLVEQNTRRALEVADKICVLESGRVTWQGDAANARADPAKIEAHMGLARVDAPAEAGRIQAEVIRDGPLQGIVRISVPAMEVVGEACRPSALHLVPYYAWNNRGARSMIVWLPRTETLARRRGALVAKR